MDYFIEGHNYSLSINNSSFKLRLHIIEGFLSDNIMGFVHIINYESNFVDTSPYNLRKDLIPIFDNRYYLENIKNLVLNIFKNIINN